MDSRTIRIVIAGLLCGSIAVLSGFVRSPGPELRVAAAADLGNAFREIAPLFEEESGAKVTLIFGSTGLLAKQVENGAPFDVFAAADERYVTELELNGKIRPGTRRLYAIGRLVVWTAEGKPPVRALGDLTKPRFRKIAIANPQHAPYGRAAEEALRSARIWKTVEPKLVFGENVLQAKQYAESGNADAAVIALSLAVGKGGSYSTVPVRMHSPLRQALGVTAQSENPVIGRRFGSFLSSPQGRRIMRKYGFLLPSERTD